VYVQILNLLSLESCFLSRPRRLLSQTQANWLNLGHVSRNLQDNPKRVHFPKIAMWRCPRHSSAPILIRLKLCVPSQMVLQHNVSLNHLDRAKSLVQPEEMQHKIDFDLVKPFPSGSSYFCPADLVGPVKNCCNTDFKIQYLHPGNHTAIPCLHSGLGGGLARRIVNPEAKPNKWPTASKSTFQLRFLVTMASSSIFSRRRPHRRYGTVCVVTHEETVHISHAIYISFSPFSLTLHSGLCSSICAHITNLLFAVNATVPPPFLQWSYRAEPGPFEA
ncbi:hypothetical protein PSHT_15048, partial [Puccinia striiformis]